MKTLMACALRGIRDAKSPLVPSKGNQGSPEAKRAPFMLDLSATLDDLFFLALMISIIIIRSVQ